MTEAEAGKKWCPFVRAIHKHANIPINRGQLATPDSPRCIASSCMAWRWLTYGAADTKDGYCGLAGRE